MRTIGIDCSNQTTWTRWLGDGRQVLIGNNIPRALISGDQDGVFNLKSSEDLKKWFEIPDEAYHVIEGVGNVPMLERGEEVVQIMVDFLCHQSSSLHCLEI